MGGVKWASLATLLYRTALTGLVEAAREVKEWGSFGYVEASLSTPELNRTLYPTKQWPEQKVDVAVALMMTVGRAMAADDGKADLMEFLRNPIFG